MVSINLNVFNTGRVAIAVPWTLTVQNSGYGAIQQVKRFCLDHTLTDLQLMPLFRHVETPALEDIIEFQARLFLKFRMRRGLVLLWKVLQISTLLQQSSLKYFATWIALLSSRNVWLWHAETLQFADCLIFGLCRSSIYNTWTPVPMVDSVLRPIVFSNCWFRMGVQLPSESYSR